MPIAITIGRGIGYAAAASVHGAYVAAQATGTFGKEVVQGTQAGYAEHSERLAKARAGMAAPAPIAIAIAPAPAGRKARA